MNHEIQKAITFIMLVMLFLIITTGFSCTGIEAKQNEEIAIDIPTQNDLNSGAPKQLDLSSNEEIWIYFDDLNYPGQLYKMTPDGREKIALPVKDVDDWFIHGDKIIYTQETKGLKSGTISQVDGRNDIIFKNQLRMMNLDGTGDIVIAKEFLPKDFSIQGDISVSYIPLFVKNNKIYFSIQVAHPFIDNSRSYVGSVNENLKIQVVTDFTCEYIDKVYVTDNGLYWFDDHTMHPKRMYFVDLETGDYRLIEEDLGCIGMYKENLYYISYCEDERTNKIYKIHVNSINDISSEEIFKFEESDLPEGWNIVGNKLYLCCGQSYGCFGWSAIKSIDLESHKVCDVYDYEDGKEFLHIYGNTSVLENGQTWYYYYIERDREEGISKGIGKINIDSGQKVTLLEGAKVIDMQIVSVPKAN